MIPASFSVKGYAAITFKEAKENMDSQTIWTTIMKINKYYPEKTQIYFSTTRGGQDKTTIEDPLTSSAIFDMIKGCVETCQIKESKGSSISLLLGACYEYKVPFGITSDDTGHKSIILTLPFPMTGCYAISAAFDGSIKRGGYREHYMVSIDLDIYIGKLDESQYHQSLAKGVQVYPFKLNHPEYYTRADSSESEPTTDQSDEEAPSTPKNTKPHQRSAAYQPKRKGIVKKKRPSGINKRLLEAFNAVAGQNQKPDTDPGNTPGNPVQTGQPEDRQPRTQTSN
uniref:Matrix protein n=1 Tax=Sambucus betanucleorhabdovirus 5 TaxID=3141833 RepID=A0AAU7E1W7_9RHAB